MKFPISLTTTMAVLALAGCGEDVAGRLVGSYTGQIASDAVTELSYTIQVDAVDKDTVEITGPDIVTVQIDVMAVGSETVTSVADSPHELSWNENGSLQVNVNGDGEYSFNGTMDGGGESDTDTDADTDTDTDADSVVTGTYTGIAGGSVNDVNYQLTVTTVDATTVSVSGSGITAFDVPLGGTATAVNAGTWADGSFTWDNGDLNLSHTPQNFNFTGSMD